MSRIRMTRLFLVATALLLVTIAALPTDAAAKKYKIFLSMSYIGNDWQAEARNMLTAMAQHKSIKDKVDLRIQVAGPNAQRQIQQINSMVQAGADAIVVYPISPTALNQAIENAIKHGVLVVAYDSTVTAKGAYNYTIDQHELGRFDAQWLVDKLGGKGNIVQITGISGTTVDTERNRGFDDVISKYPDIKVIAKVNGMWSQAVAREKLSQIVATNGWEKIDGIWTQCGCYTAVAMQLEAGIPEDKLCPCAGEAANGHRIQMLPPGSVEGVSDVYRPVGAPSASAGSPVYAGALALKMAVKALDGEKIESNYKLPQNQAVSDQMKLCETGSWQEMSEGCNVFDPSLVPPGWFAAIYSPFTPEVGFDAALLGQPEK